MCFPPLKTSIAATAFVFGSLAFTASVSAEISVKTGDKIAFLGDSITAGGWGNPAGYVRLVMAGLEANGIKAEAIPAGISGHKSNQMLARLEKDVLSKKPNWMTLSCGVNDVWHGNFGIPLNASQAVSGTYELRPGEPEKGTYEKNISKIIDTAVAAGVRPVLLTATVIKEDLSSPENQKLAPYNDFLRTLARDKKLPIADLNGDFQVKIKEANTPGKNAFTSDGVHMNTEGNKVMATGVLKALGFSGEELQKAALAWAPLAVQAEESARAAAAAKAAKAEAQKAAAPAEKK